MAYEKKKRKVYFSIGGKADKLDLGKKVSGGRFTKRTRNHNAKIIK